MTISTIKFSQMTSGGDLTAGDLTPGLEAGANVLFNNPWTFLAPGSTGTRPPIAPSMYYQLRLNTTLRVYEYYDPVSATWVELSGSGTGTINPGVMNNIPFYPANGTALSPLSSAANSLLATNGSEVPSLVTVLPTGLTLPGATITGSTAALTSGQITATPTNPTDIANKAYVDSATGSGVTSITGTTNQVIASSATGSVTLSLPQDIALGSTPTFGGLTLTSIPLNPASGGTGVNNGIKTITLGGSLITDGVVFFNGAFSGQFNLTAATNVTFPTSGTLLTSASAVTSIAGTTNQIVASASTGSVTLTIASNPILPGTGGFTLPTGTTVQRAGGAGTMRFNSQTSVF